MKQDGNTYMKVVNITQTMEFITFFWWVGGDRKEETGTARKGTAAKFERDLNWIVIS